MGQWLSEYLERLNRSFAALYALLERPQAARRAVVVLLLIHSGLLAYSAYVHSPTLNEPGHLVAGLSNWKFGRFDIYSVNPPLVRMVAALPVMAVGYEEDWSGFYTGPGARPESAMGEDFVAANGERSFFLFMIARWACIPFSWIGGLVCFLWARDLYGRPAGVMACGIWCLEPNISAHASLMTPDAHATALGLAACYTFWRWLKKPTWSQAALTGVVLGLAELAKTTLILFYPLWPLMWVIYRWPERQNMVARNWLREAGMLMVRMAIGLYILNLGYAFDGSLKPLGDFHFVSNLLTDDTDPVEGNHKELQEKGSDASNHNRFLGTWLAVAPVPFPAHYLIGIDLQQQDFEDYGRPSYLRGEWRDRGWWYYYLYAVAIKVPLGLWMLAAIALLPRQFRRLRTSFRNEFVLLFPPLVIFAVVSSKTGFSEHMRYVLPAFPFFFIWVSGNMLTASLGRYNASRSRRRVIHVPLFSANIIAFCWLFSSSLWIWPHSLNYFNELVGGPLNGSRHLLGSSFDWGQDLRYLRTWVAKMKQPQTRSASDCAVYVACCGYVAPSEVGIPVAGAMPPTDLYRLPESDKAPVQARDGNRLLASSCFVASKALIEGFDWTPPGLGSVPSHRVSRWMKKLRGVESNSLVSYSLAVFELENSEE